MPYSLSELIKRKFNMKKSEVIITLNGKLLLLKEGDELNIEQDKDYIKISQIRDGEVIREVNSLV